MNDTYSGAVPAEEQVEVYVLLVQGVGDSAVAVLDPGNGEKVSMAAEQIAVDTGLEVEQLPGQRLVAVVRDGELSGFVRRE